MSHPRLLHSSLLLAALAPALALAGCAPPGGDGGAPAPEASAASSSTSSPAAGGGITLSPMPGSPAFPGATLTFEDAGDRQPGANTFGFGVEAYELGVQTSDAADKGIANSAQGQHIHLIIDNGPYSAHYEPGAEVELAAGRPVMLAFLSRSYHESVKEPSAYVLRQLTIGESGGDEVDLAAPHLFYSRPKGSYAGADTEKLMLDFFLVNTTLSPTGNRVLATINGEQFVITEWVPHVIEGLPLGEVEITLELVDAEGNRIPSPYNPVTRTVTLEPAG